MTQASHADVLTAGRAPLPVARVTAIEAIPVALPLRRPLRFASGTIHTADHVIVRVHADTGAVGVAEAQPRPYTYGETQASIVAAVRDRIAPRLVGVDPLAREHVHRALADISADHCARAAVEVAIADLAGRLLGVPCARLLGGDADTLTVASMVSFGTPAEMAAEAVGLCDEHGIATFKVKVGREPALDVAAVAAIRDALPNAALYVDANRGWAAERARAAAPALVELGVQAIEEPLDLADDAGRRDLACEWDVPLAGDESCRTLAETAAQLRDGAVGQVSVKVARTAFVESREIVALCRAATTPAVVGSQYEGALGARASIAFAAAALPDKPAEIGNVLDLAHDVVAPPTIRAGRVEVPTGPGLGAELDDDALTHYRSDR